MKLYLSSYGIGNSSIQLQEWLNKTNKEIAYIPSALDGLKMKKERREFRIQEDLKDLKSIGANVELLDLRDYFEKKEELEQKLQNFAMIYVSGGNVFILRQAMFLSGLDEVLMSKINSEEFIYAGYSAAGCVLSQSLKPYQIVDDPKDFPYEKKKTMWEGLGLIDFAFLPHFESDHHESNGIEQELEYCKKLSIPYKTLGDGEVLMLEKGLQ